MTDDDLLLSCLAADPVDYWAGATSCLPDYLTRRGDPPWSPTVLHISVIPPVAGGAPGLLDDIKNALISLVWDHIIKPAFEWLLSNLFAPWRTVKAWLGSFLDAVLGDFYRWYRGWWWGGIRPEFRPYQDPRWETESPPLFRILTALFSFPFSWLASRVLDVRDTVGGWINAARDAVGGAIDFYARWLRDRVSDLVNTVAGWINAARDAVGGAIDFYSRWLRDRVSDLVNTVGAWITGAANTVGGWISSARDTVGGWIAAARDFIVDRIFGAVVAGAQTLINGLQDVFAFIVERILAGLRAFGDFLADTFQTVFLGPVDALVDTVNAKLAIPGKLIRGEYPTFLAFLDDLADPVPAIAGALVGALIIGLVIAAVTASVMGVLIEPLLEPHVQDSRARVGAQLLPPITVQEALNRDFISESDASDQLSRAGYGDTNRQALLDLRRRLPGASDLVRFAVREVFTPDIVSRFGLSAEFPGRFAEELDKQGFDREWAEAYWGAHWDLPSVTQGFEMFHRGVIDLGTLNLLLRTADVMPFWRQKVIDIAYNPLTRIDLRRFLKAGVIDEARVFRGYLDLGYDDANARIQTDFALQFATPEDRTELDDLDDASRSQIRLAYRRSVIDRSEAIDLLVDTGATERLADFLLAIDDAALAVNPFIDADVDVRELTRATILDAYAAGVWDRDRAAAELEAQGYLPGSAELLLAIEDYRLARGLRLAQENVVRQRYVSYQLDAAAAVAELETIGIGDARRQLLVTEWDVDRTAGTRQLTLAEVRRYLAAGAFTEDQALARVLRLGYNLDDALLQLGLT
jgi:hypothetical protein